ncbi:exonuclease domain-containing protein [Nanoarchaeota archaeon]
MIVLDIETTGLIPKLHSIVSIGAVDFNNPENQFYDECRIRRGARIDPIALELNGFTEERMLDEKKSSLKEISQLFLKWAENIEYKSLAGENVSFDQDFLEDTLRRHDIPWPFGYRLVDLHTASYSHHLKRGVAPPIKDGLSRLSLDRTLDYVGIPPEPKPHNALNGAKLGAEALSRLLHGKNLLEEYKHHRIPDYLIP